MSDDIGCRLSTPDDKQILEAFYQTLSQATLRRLTHGRSISKEAFVKKATQPQSKRARTILAINPENTVAGISQYCHQYSVPYGQYPDIAILIGDSFQRQGVGKILLRELVTYAKEDGYQGLLARMQENNIAASRLVSRIARDTNIALIPLREEFSCILYF
jgi:RimJ/RimL family protein N-acetyltransferase